MENKRKNENRVDTMRTLELIKEKAIIICKKIIINSKSFLIETLPVKKDLDSSKTEILKHLNARIDQVVIDIRNETERSLELFRQNIEQQEKEKWEKKLVELQESIKLLEEKVKNLTTKTANEPQQVEDLKCKLPKIFTVDILTNYNPIGFMIDKLDDNYGGGIFVITQISENDAVLTINENLHSQQRIFGSLRKIFEEVCEPFELVSFPQKIRMVRKGILSKQNNTWEIKQKMKIKLIKNDSDDF